MKLTSLLQLIDKLQQVGKIDNLQQVRNVFGYVCMIFVAPSTLRRKITFMLLHDTVYHVITSIILYKF